MENYDAIIIGGGIAGISCAARLSRERHILVLETESRHGFHATGRSAAYFAPAYGNATIREITAASREFFESPPSGFTETALLNPRAAMFIAQAGQQTEVQAMLAASPHLQRRSGAQAAQQVPVLNERTTMAALDATGGDLDVAAILDGFLRTCRQQGASLLTSEAAESLRYSNDLWTVNDRFQTPLVINAAGAWADHVSGLAGLSPLGLEPKRRTALLVDSPVDCHDWPLVIDVEEQFYFKPDAGQLLLSPADETPSAPCDAAAEELDVAIAIDRIQAIADIPVTRVNHRWAGLRTFAPDRELVVGADPRNTSFFWLAGQGGYGVQTSPALSEIACHLVTGSGDASIADLAQKLAPSISPQRLLAKA